MLVILGVTLGCVILGAGIGIGFAVGNKNSSSERSNSLNSSKNETQGQELTTSSPTPFPSDLSRPSGAPTAAAIVSPTLRPMIPLSKSDTPSVTPTTVSTSTPSTHLPTTGSSTIDPSTVIPTAVPTDKDEFGMIKVCNGNYGESRWSGISKVLLENDVIVASAVRLNEFYMSGADDAERQYTLCHELGHSFGLPHTDENFFNKDLGNCLDYTNNPAANQSPGAINFERLATVYGTLETSPAPTLEDASGINLRLLRTKASLKRLDQEFVLGSSSNYETRHLRTGGFELRAYRLPP